MMGWKNKVFLWSIPLFILGTGLSLTTNELLRFIGGSIVYWMPLVLLLIWVKDLEDRVREVENRLRPKLTEDLHIVQKNIKPGWIKFEKKKRNKKSIIINKLKKFLFLTYS